MFTLAFILIWIASISSFKKKNTKIPTSLVIMNENKNSDSGGHKLMKSLGEAFYTSKSKCHPSADEWIERNWYACTVEHCSAVKSGEVQVHVKAWGTLELRC